MPALLEVFAELEPEGEIGSLAPLSRDAGAPRLSSGFKSVLLHQISSEMPDIQPAERRIRSCV
jgi:hypothetical protein